MAGIDSLLKGAIGALSKDKVSPFLTPTQRDLLALLLNPQGYLLGTGITAAANALGYGNEYKELKAGAEDDKEYYREVMRDSIGDALPESIGDFVRSTPRAQTEEPSGMYYDPNANDFVQSTNPVAASPASESFASAFDSNSVFNTNSPNYVGPANPNDMNSSIYSGNLTELLTMLNDYQATNNPETVVNNTQETVPEGAISNVDTGATVSSNTSGDDFAPIDFGSFMDFGDIYGEQDFGGGWGGGGKYMDSEYAKGGQIYRGIR